MADARRGSVAATLIRGDGAQLALYATIDGGRTWSLVSTAPTAVPTLGTTVSVSALGRTDWTAALDQGRRPTAIGTTPGAPALPRGTSPLSASRGRGFVASYGRIGASVAWAIVSRCTRRAGCTSSLLRSLDGGALWTVSARLS